MLHRSLDSIDFDQASLDTGLSCPCSESKTRAEFAEDSDINSLLSRYGALPQGRSLAFGEVDMDVDLLQAHLLVQKAREAFERLPRDLREHAGDWETFARGLKEVAPEELRSEEAASSPPGGASPAAS